MNFGGLGFLSFAAPWMLMGFLAIPALWWLMRFVPPRAEHVSFPSLLLLRDLFTPDDKAQRAPWWLIVMRSLLVAALVLALAGPVLKPAAVPASSKNAPMLIVLDDGWTAASRWTNRQTLLKTLAEEAEEAKAILYLAPTCASASSTPSALNDFSPLSPADFREKEAAFMPHAYACDRTNLAKKLETSFSRQKGRLHVVWLSDGVKDEGSDVLTQTLEQLAGSGGFEFFTDASGAGALGLFLPELSAAKGYRAHVEKADMSARHGAVAAVTAKGDRLAVMPFDIAADHPSTEVEISLPLEMRNQVVRLHIEGEASAGGVFLLDGRSQRRKVGILASEDVEQAQPLLSSSHFLKKALSPFAELTIAPTANIAQAIDDFLSRSVSVIVLSDVGHLLGPTAARLKKFVENGGTLVRFAGPRLEQTRLEQAGDQLLPAPLREGGRALGGAMTWAAPQKLAPFEPGSLFQGLAIPSDVIISRQVLADPAKLTPDVKVWSRLTDGTPLVTATRLKSGQLVFIHVTANASWSNLPISGLFVEMLHKIVDAAPLNVKPEAQQGQALETSGKTFSSLSAPRSESSSSPATRTADVPQTLKPWRLLDGFGVLSDPPSQAQPIEAAALGSLRAKRETPAGLYGPPDAARALNIMEKEHPLAPLLKPSAAIERRIEAGAAIYLAPWAILMGLMMFIADTAASVLKSSRRRGKRFVRPTIALLLLSMALAGGDFNTAKATETGPDKTTNATASTSTTAPKTPSQDQAAQFALRASLETHLAYVLTGDADTDRVSQAGLSGLSKILATRTAVEPAEPMGIDVAEDELVFFPLIYWPVLDNAEPLSNAVLAKLDAYMKQGGMIVFDTKNEEGLPQGNLAAEAGSPKPLARLLGKLDIPPLQRLPQQHVLSKSFYLLQSFPGRWDNGNPWVEAGSQAPDDNGQHAVKSDGVSSIIVTSNDFAAAWALDENDHPLFPVVPGGEDQRELAYRTGVNIVMYALTGNYKFDQVHVPYILERLGH